MVDKSFLVPVAAVPSCVVVDDSVACSYIKSQLCVMNDQLRRLKFTSSFSHCKFILENHRNGMNGQQAKDMVWGFT
jgi:hypothetical protein